MESSEDSGDTIPKGSKQNQDNNDASESPETTENNAKEPESVIKNGEESSDADQKTTEAESQPLIKETAIWFPVIVFELYKLSNIAIKVTFESVEIYSLYVMKDDKKLSRL